MNFFDKIEEYNSNICLIDENNKTLFYKDVLKTSEKITKNLKERSLIFVLAHNHTEFVINYIGFFKKGLVQVLLNANIDINQLKNLIKSYLPKYIFLPSSRIKDFKNYEVVANLNKHKILILNKKKSYSINKDLALLLNTSGSTGSKKFVRISYENIYDNTKNIVRYLNINQKHKTITTMPPFYTYGLSIINTHLYSGASIIVTNLRVVEKAFWKLLRDQQVTSFGGVPYFYEMIKKLNFSKINLPNLKYLTQAGGPLSRELTEYFLNYAETNNISFIVMYGQVEATSRITYLPFNMSRKKIGSIGVPLFGGKIYLKSDKSSDGKKGEIVYEGKNVSMGYANNFKDLNKGDENCGILNTGDLAMKDKDEYLYITGRKSRDVKLFGHRVNLDELEQILSKKGYNCLCCGFDNKVTVFHINKNYNNLVLKNLSKITDIHISCFKLRYIKKFPLNDIGKVSYKKLEKLL
tara:strand:+ start:228 stop:1625 length:1398 start_codon:yes stop_codon:yes gene_type:complete